MKTPSYFSQINIVYNDVKDLENVLRKRFNQTIIVNISEIDNQNIKVFIGTGYHESDIGINFESALESTYAIIKFMRYIYYENSFTDFKGYLQELYKR